MKAVIMWLTALVAELVPMDNRQSVHATECAIWEEHCKLRQLNLQGETFLQRFTRRNVRRIMLEPEPLDEFHEKSPLHFCNLTALFKMYGYEQANESGPKDRESDLKRTEDKLTGEMKGSWTTSGDETSKDMFSFYACVRWVPDEFFWQVAEEELANDIFKSINQRSKSITQAIVEFYQKFQFVPLLCSKNFDVYKDKSKTTHTYFRKFEEDALEFADWLNHAEHGQVWHKLEHADNSSCGSLRMNSKSCKNDTRDVALSSAMAELDELDGHTADESFPLENNLWLTTKELFKDVGRGQNFTEIKTKSWSGNLVNWKAHFPYHSFIAQHDGIDAENLPASIERFMICFGGRVGGKMNRQPSGRNIFVNQKIANCHGWLMPGDASRVVKHIVHSWRPPTCKLSEMANRIQRNIADAHEQMENDLHAVWLSATRNQTSFNQNTSNWSIYAQPTQVESVECNGETFYHGMRVAAKEDLHYSDGNCSVSCLTIFQRGTAGDVVISAGSVAVVFDGDPYMLARNINVTKIKIVPYEYRRVEQNVTLFNHKLLFDSSRLSVTDRPRGNLTGVTKGSHFKWIICPVSRHASSHELNEAFSVDDALHHHSTTRTDTSREKDVMAGNAISRARCTRKPSLDEAMFRDCQIYNFAEFQSELPEAYFPLTGHQENFVCPRQLLTPATEQLEVFMKKEGMCLLRMTDAQQRRYGWQDTEHSSLNRRFKMMENPPRVDFELVKLLDVEEEVGPRQVSFGRSCSLQEKKINSRFCMTTSLQKKWTSVKEMVDFVQVSLGTYGNVSYGVIRDLIESFQGVAEMNQVDDDIVAGTKAWTNLMNIHKTNVSIVDDLHLEGGPERSERLVRKVLGFSGAAEFLHSVSFQTSAEENNITSHESKTHLCRYAVVCPCNNFNPALELALHKEWTEVVLKVFWEGVRQTPEILQQTNILVMIRGEAQLYLDKRDENKSFFVYEGTSSTGIASAVKCEVNSEGCIPEDLCDYSGNLLTGYKCEPRNTDEATMLRSWWALKDMGLAYLLGGMVTPERPVEDLRGMRFRFVCGPKSALGKTLTPKPSSASLKKCLDDGVRYNAELKAKEPWKLYFPDEIVVAVTMEAIEEAKCTPPSHSTRHLLCQNAVVTKNLDAHLRVVEKKGGAGTVYQGLRTGSGLPEGAMREIFLTPGDMLRVVRLLF